MTVGREPIEPHPTRISDLDLHLFHQGTHSQMGDHLGAHPQVVQGQSGTFFAVWAPNAEAVSVVGDWNNWQAGVHTLSRRGAVGVWEAFIPGVGTGAAYRYVIQPAGGGAGIEKLDPYAHSFSPSGKTAAQVCSLEYTWGDSDWMKQRQGQSFKERPISIYEVHLGSWRRIPEQDNRPLSYREIAPYLAEHVRRLGFTHVELMPVLEHPFYGSWGYQVTGYFAPTQRYGSPQDLMFLIDTLHQAGIGVIIDWVPAHFPTDALALAQFDGTCLYEHSDPRKGRHPDWKTAIFNYGRHEVRSFLISSACHWLRHYHADGLRVDGVASMLYLDYSRPAGEWIPNSFGGRENLEAIDFLRQMNQSIAAECPGTLTIAEESTAWPMVTRPVHLGGLGFDLKWDMGWMHDTLRYLGRDPIHRRYHHNELSFRSLYQASECFVLPLSHDEVVHGKGSLLRRMPGDTWQRFANLRLLYAWMWAQPGKKLLFMGDEFAQEREWNHDQSLDWHLLDATDHARIMLLVGMLNRLYREQPAMHDGDCDSRGFAWNEADDAEQSVLVFERRSLRGEAPLVIVFNFTPVPRANYRIGVEQPGTYRELLNTDAQELGGSGHGNFGAIEPSPVPWKGKSLSLCLTLPPLGALFLRAE